MKRFKTFLIFCMLGIVTASAEILTWNIGYPNEADVVATLNTVDSTLTISGTGDMIVDHRGKSDVYFHAP